MVEFGGISGRFQTHTYSKDAGEWRVTNGTRDCFGNSRSVTHDQWGNFEGRSITRTNAGRGYHGGSGFFGGGSYMDHLANKYLGLGGGGFGGFGGGGFGGLGGFGFGGGLGGFGGGGFGGFGGDLGSMMGMMRMMMMGDSLGFGHRSPFMMGGMANGYEYSEHNPWGSSRIKRSNASEINTYAKTFRNEIMPSIKELNSIFNSSDKKAEKK